MGHTVRVQITRLQLLATQSYLSEWEAQVWVNLPTGASLHTLGNQLGSLRVLPSWDGGSPAQLEQSYICLPGALEWLLGHMPMLPLVYKLQGYWGPKWEHDCRKMESILHKVLCTNYSGKQSHIHTSIVFEIKPAQCMLCFIIIYSESIFYVKSFITFNSTFSHSIILKSVSLLYLAENYTYVEA